MSTTSFPSDGDIPSGSISDVTILELSESYVMEDFQWDQSSAIIERMHADGTASGSKAVTGFTTGSGTLQMLSDSTEPRINDTFVYNSSGWYISNRGRTFSQGDSHKMAVQVRKCENPLISFVADQSLTQSSAMTDVSPTATGPVSGLTYTWSAAGLPTGVSINASTGVISGTPTTVETTTATIKASATLANGNSVLGIRKVSFTVSAST